MEAGTGKTRAALELVRSTTADYILWITPFQTKQNLRDEINKWGGLSCDIVGVESISQSDRIYLEFHKKCRQAKNAFIIMDESLKIKNVAAKRTNRLIELSRFSEYRLILNGTPLSKNLLDLYTQMQFLSPKILKLSYAQFKNKFCEYVKVTTRNGHRTYSREYIKKYHNIEYLYSLIEPFVFESKLTLSVGTQHHNLYYSLSNEEFKNHEYIKNELLDDKVLLAMNNNLFLMLTQKLQHNYSLSASKFSIVDKVLEDTDRSKVLIYAKYIDTQQALREHYKDIKILSLQKHAYGLNLQDYNTIIFWDKTWDFAQREQAERRIFRQGQNSDCVYYDLTASVGLDQMINACIDKKRKLLDIFSELTIDELKSKL